MNISSLSIDRFQNVGKSNLYLHDKHIVVQFTYTILFKTLSAGAITYLSWKNDSHSTDSISVETDFSRSFQHFFQFMNLTYFGDVHVEFCLNPQQWHGKRGYKYKTIWKQSYVRVFLLYQLFKCNCWIQKEQTYFQNKILDVTPLLYEERCWCWWCWLRKFLY